MKKVELFNDHFQNFKVYGIPHAQLISHCLNKDVATIADNPKAYLLRQIINFNNQCKKSLQS